jgi:membrane protein YqaA with SNARE-associated domain
MRQMHEPPSSAPPTSDPAPATAVPEPTPVREQRKWRSILGVLLMLAALTAVSGLFLFFPVDYEWIGSTWGYAGVFAVVFVTTASFVLPIPYLLIVARAGTFLDPWLVAAVAGAAGALGELTGYLVGVGGSCLVQRGRWYDRSRAWICTYGFWCIAFFSCVPNPFFDALGAAAGVLRYSAWRFAVACFIGKAVKFLIAALIGAQAHTFGWLD